MESGMGRASDGALRKLTSRVVDLPAVWNAPTGCEAFECVGSHSANLQ